MKSNYELSLWKNVLVPSSTKMVDGETITIPSHYAEEKVSVIGGSSLSSPMKAFAPVFKENINGTHSLEFQMYYLVPDEEDYGIFNAFRQGGRVKKAKQRNIDNPFAHLILPESRIKLKKEGKWYDFIVKEVVKNKEKKLLTYQCIDSYVNELSRTGYNLLFDTELGNNIGTAPELIEQVLEGTGYHFDAEGSDLIREWLEEPVYEGRPIKTILAQNDLTQEDVSIPADARLMVYYTPIQELSNSEEQSGQTRLQFGYADPYMKEEMSPLVTNADPFTITVDWSKELDFLVFRLPNDPDVWLRIHRFNGVSTEYRAKRLVRKQRSKYDPISEEYVDVFRATADGVGFNTDDIIYAYKKSQFTSPSAVSNLMINGKNFTSSTGWSGEDMVFTMYPLFTSDISGNVDNFHSDPYLKFGSNKVYYNKAMTSSSYMLEEGIQVGQEYVVRFKIRGGSATQPSGGYLESGMIPSLRTYDDQGFYVQPDSGGKSYATVTHMGQNGDWIEYKLRITESVPRVEIRGRKIGLFFTTNRIVWLYQAEFFRLEYGEDEFGNPVMLEPEVLNTYSIAKTEYSYYNYTQQEGSNKDDLLYLWQSTTDWENPNIEPVFNEDFEKVRTLSIGESTRFNILQSIAELFEAWIEFDIEHEENGELVYDERGVPQKKVRLVKEKGHDSGLEFVYGIDLKGLKRTYQSNEISTKTIVTPNILSLSGKDVITIARAPENYSRANYILDLDYYIMRETIDAVELMKDLYTPSYGFGLYEILRQNNLEHERVSGILSARRTELAKIDSTLETYEGLIHGVQDEIQKVKESLIFLAEAPSWEAAQSYIQQNADDATVQSKVMTLTELRNSLEHYQIVRGEAEDAKTYLKTVIEELRTTAEGLLETIKEIESKFQTKYAQFLQEGVWSDSNYLDDSLYYLDARSIATRSSRPQVAYEISVIRLNMLEDFKAKQFRVGDIARIEDVDFLGLKWVEGIKTPIREKVVLSEAVYYLDDPSKDTYMVQNYKTQFEDLFQRIVANVQQLQISQDGAMQSSNELVKNLGSLAWGDRVEKAMLGETIVTGGFIQTDMIRIGRGSMFDPGYDPQENSVQAKNDLAAKLGYASYAEMAEKALQGETVIDNGFINTELIRVGTIVSQNGLYGLNLNTGKVLMKDADFQGGTIGGWTVTENMIEYKPTSTNASRIVISADPNELYSFAAYGSNTARRFSVDKQGYLYAEEATIKGHIEASSGSFSGSLNAATGTFAGNLSAAGGTFSGNLSAAGGTFSGNLQAAGGTFSGDLSAAGGSFTGSLSIGNGTFSVNSSGYMTASNAHITGGTLSVGSRFNVSSGGTLTATSVDISGAINATSGSFSGSIYSSSGSIGGWEITPSYFRRADDTVGIGTGASVGSVFWAGYNGSTYRFRVTRAGTLSATSANISGAITATSGSFTGNIYAESGSIGGVNFSSGSDGSTFAGSILVQNIFRSGGNGFIGSSINRFNTIYLRNPPSVGSGDVRLKKEIHSLPTELINYLAVIEPVFFTSEDDQLAFGYIAQDVERELYKALAKQVGYQKAREEMKKYRVLEQGAESYLYVSYHDMAMIKDKYYMSKIKTLEDRLLQLEEVLNV